MKQQCGFSFLELTIVIALIGILMIYPLWQWPAADIAVESQAKQLQTDIELAQALSIYRNQRYRINFSSGSYSITDLSGAQSVAPYAAVSFSDGISLTVGSSPSFIVFDGYGAPYQTASLPGTPLATTASYVLQASDGSSRTLSINTETGRVSLS